MKAIRADLYRQALAYNALSVFALFSPWILLLFFSFLLVAFWFRRNIQWNNISNWRFCGNPLWWWKKNTMSMIASIDDSVIYQSQKLCRNKIIILMKKKKTFTSFMIRQFSNNFYEIELTLFPHQRSSFDANSINSCLFVSSRNYSSFTKPKANENTSFA